MKSALPVLDPPTFIIDHLLITIRRVLHVSKNDTHLILFNGHNDGRVFLRLAAGLWLRRNHPLLRCCDRVSTQDTRPCRNDARVAHSVDDEATAEVDMLVAENRTPSDPAVNKGGGRRKKLVSNHRPISNLIR